MISLIARSDAKPPIARPVISVTVVKNTDVREKKEVKQSVSKEEKNRNQYCGSGPAQGN